MSFSCIKEHFLITITLKGHSQWKPQLNYTIWKSFYFTSYWCFHGMLGHMLLLFPTHDFGSRDARSTFYEQLSLVWDCCYTKLFVSIKRSGNCGSGGVQYGRDSRSENKTREYKWLSFR